MTKGLDLPLAGAPVQRISDPKAVSRVALLPGDYPGLRARLAVREGDAVRRGDLLFEDRTRPGVGFTAPGSGRVLAIHRGARRRLESIVVELDEEELDGSGKQARFATFRHRNADELTSNDVRALLLESGLWTALRSRPFGSVADPQSEPFALFVTAMDTEPHAPSVDLMVDGREDDLEIGLAALARLTAGPLYLCRALGSRIGDGIEHARFEEFGGPHPAGTPGVHIHWLAPVDRERIAWHVGIQDTLAIGRLFRTGELEVDRIVSIAGPAARKPRLLRTRLGASIDELADGETVEGEVRVVSGSALSGRAAHGPINGFLGRYHRQVTLLREVRERRFFGWLAPGWRTFSALPVFVSRLFGSGRRYDMTTATHGERRALIPIGIYERVVPMEVLPTPLLRALMAEDVELAEDLGCLELEEEDLSLCTFVCPGKVDYGIHLRRVLDQLMEGA